MMFFIVGSYYDGFYTNLNREAYRAQLGQVSDYLSSNLIDVVTLSQLSENDVFLLKDIQIPPFIGERLYNISLIRMTPTYGDDELIRVLTRIDALGIYATSDLPWSLDVHIQIYSDQTIDKRGYNVTITSHLLSDAEISRMAQTKGFAKMVVWCSKVGGNITIGLGTLDIPEVG